jgi:hypothetical protein
MPVVLPKKSDYFIYVRLICSTIFIGAYIFFLLLYPQFSPIDDYYFLSTIQSNKWLPLSTFIGNARFYPLDGWEYNFVMKILPAIPFSYYLFNAIELVVFVSAFFFLLNKTHSNKWLIAVLVALTMTSTGFIHAWFRLLVPERGEILLFVLFLCSYFIYQQKKSLLLLVMILIFGNLVLYYKEPAFLMLACFAFLHLIISWKVTDKQSKILDTLILVSSGLFLVAYYLFSYRFRSGVNYAEAHTAGNISNVFQYFMTWEPILPFCLIPAILLRLVQLLSRRFLLHPLYDSMIVAACVYVAVFFFLGISTPYYLLPTYVFIIPAFLFFLNELKITKWYYKTLGLSLILFTMLFYYISVPSKSDLFSSLPPKSLTEINNFRYVPFNYNLMLNFLEKDLKSRYLNQRTNIFLSVNRNSGYEAYYSLENYLKFRGVASTQFDLLSSSMTDHRYKLPDTDSSSSYSVFAKEKPSKIMRGDYLIVLPTSLYTSPTQLGKSVLGDCSTSYLTSYRLLFHTESPYAFWGKDLLNLLRGKQLVHDCNRDVNYYVLIHK